MPKKKNKNPKNQPGISEAELSERKLSEETEAGETAENSAEAEPAENPAKETEKSTDKQPEKERKRFRFDWELEENLLEALDEDALDLTEADEGETEPVEIEGRSAITLAQAVQAFFGLFLIIFSVIGVAATALKIADLAEKQRDNSEQLEYFEDFVMPLAACDSPTFEGASSLNEDVILSAACWDIVFNPSAFYEYSAGSYRVSYLDIDRRVAKLFGPGLNYSHKTVGDTELRFEYDEESGMYYIPAFPRSQAYYPDVTEIKELDGGQLELTVDYRLPITNWIESVDTVEKKMIYTVVPSGTEYVVTSLRIGEIDATEAN